MSRSLLPSSSSLRTARAVARVVLPTLWLGLGSGQGGLLAWQAGDSVPAWRPAAALESEVRTQLSQRWEVDPETLVLEWGEPRSGALPEDFDRVSLLGTGRDGRWVASFAPEQGDADHQSVLLRAGVVVPQTVAGRRLERGETVGEEDMVLESRIHWGAPRGLPDPCQAGWVTQRPVEVGDLLSPPAVKPPLMVVSGRPVTLHWSQGKVELSLRGTAVGSAALGERVFVRTDAGTRLDGWVEGPGRVRISGKPKESGR